MEASELLIETLGTILDHATTLPDSPNRESWHILYMAAENSNSLNENTASLIILVTDTIYDPDIVEVNGQRFEGIADLWLVKDVVEQARWQKPDVSPDELATALQYYLDNDAYLELTH